MALDVVVASVVRCINSKAFWMMAEYDFVLAEAEADAAVTLRRFVYGAVSAFNNPSFFWLMAAYDFAQAPVVLTLGNLHIFNAVIETTNCYLLQFHIHRHLYSVHKKNTVRTEDTMRSAQSAAYYEGFQAVHGRGLFGKPSVFYNNVYLISHKEHTQYPGPPLKQKMSVRGSTVLSLLKGPLIFGCW